MTICTDAPAGFELFWAKYLKRRARAAAIKAWNKLQPTPELQALILSALEWQFQQKDWRKDHYNFAPNAATYLNGRRWEDEPPAAPQGANDTRATVRDANVHRTATRKMYVFGDGE